MYIQKSNFEQVQALAITLLKNEDRPISIDVGNNGIMQCAWFNNGEITVYTSGSGEEFHLDDEKRTVHIHRDDRDPELLKPMDSIITQVAAAIVILNNDDLQKELNAAGLSELKQLEIVLNQDMQLALETLC